MNEFTQLTALGLVGLPNGNVSINFNSGQIYIFNQPTDNHSFSTIDLSLYIVSYAMAINLVRFRTFSNEIN